MIGHHHIRFRRELRFALLAAMETCWVYSILAYLAAVIDLPRTVSPLSIFAAYWLALVVGRVLPQRKERWVVLQAIALGIAFLTLISVARIEFYSRYELWDFSWLPRYVLVLFAFPRGIAAEHLAAMGVLYAFVRGLGFGQRPMTLWFVGFQFRLGILVFFLFLLLASTFKPFDATSWIFVYFFVSLLAIALARIDDMESQVQIGSRWAITLLASVALVLFLGLALMQILTLDSATTILILLAPLWVVLAAIVILITTPFAMLLGWLIDLLSPYFANVADVFRSLMDLISQDRTENLLEAQKQVAQFSFLEPLLKTIFVLAIILTVGYWIVKTLNRRMKLVEEERYERELLSQAERRAQRAGTPRKKTPRRRVGPLGAESIRRIYAALVARASEAGLPRAAAETPYEYLPRLERTWPDQAADLRAITNAYVDVHYGEREFAAKEVDGLRAMWQSLAKILKRKM